MTMIYDGRCQHCYMRLEVCLCPVIPRLSVATHLTILMHFRENYKTTNSGRIACLALPNSKIVLHGLQNKILSSSDVLESNYQPVLLTLNDKSEILSPELLKNLGKPMQLIVPDGNWRQANKMGSRLAFLQNIPWIKLPAEAVKPRPRLRAEHNPEGMATIEAIARAMGIIESPEVEHALDKLYETMVERTLSTRPQSRAEMNLKNR